jgi:hypothetical protein
MKIRGILTVPPTHGGRKMRFIFPPMKWSAGFQPAYYQQDAGAPFHFWRYTPVHGLSLVIKGTQILFGRSI